jgi:hypothetical protein
MRIAFSRILLASLAVLHASGCNRAAPDPLSHEMYVWQLAWTLAVRSALERTSPVMARVHVLALEIDPFGEVREPALDVETLRRLATPVVPVVRIDGRARDLPRARGRISAMLENWKRQLLPLSALEIDFDCGTSQLDAYARFLTDLRSQMPAGTRLTITALPAWMSSPQLPVLARAADEVVLQVHSVRDPVNGLFNADEALGWIEAYSRLSSTPFKVALPTYGSRVRWAGDGRVVSVESETSPVFSGGVSRELAVDPEAMARFVRDLSARRVKGLAGIVWFRMPTDADKRAWSVPTFLAVIQSKPLHHSVSATFSPRGAGGGDIVITNTGTLDAPVPKEIRLDATCRDADAVSGYVLERRDGSLRWARASARMMRAGATVNVGWANCSEPGAPLEISY